MMRNVTYSLLILASGPVFGFECLDYQASTESIDTHIDKASDIFIGRVIGGRVDESARFGGELTVTVRINHIFKGSLGDRVVLETGRDQLFQPIELNANYVFLLYGKRELDSCGYLIPVGPVESVDELVLFTELESEREPNRFTDALATLLARFRL